MGRSSYAQSTTSSTRTFQTGASRPDAPKKKKKISSKLSGVKLQAVPRAQLPTNRMPWVIVAVLTLFSLFMFVQYNQAKSKLTTPKVAGATTQQVTDTLSKVKKLVIVPTDETPRLAKISDADKFAGQTFFANAKDGDIVVVYAKAKQAILYRPSTNQIVTMAPVANPEQN